MPKKTPRRARRRASKVGWSYPITFRSLVVRSTARTQNFDYILTFFLHLLKLFGIIWDVSGGSLEVVRSNFCQKYFRTFYLLKKCLGGSRRVLGVPRTVLKNINLSGNLTFFLHIFLIVAYCIAYCTAYCIAYSITKPNQTKPSLRKSSEVFESPRKSFTSCSYDRLVSRRE